MILWDLTLMVLVAVFYGYLPTLKVDGERLQRKMKTRALKDSLGSFSKLTHLDLSGCSYLTAGLLPFLATLPKLSSLILAGCRGILLQGMPNLANLTQLRELDLSSCMQRYTGADGSWETVQAHEATAALKMLCGKMTGLTRLHLDGWPLSLETFKTMNTNLKSLEYLSLQSWKLNVAVSLNVFRCFKDLTNLKRLEVFGCGVTIRQKKEIQKLFPDAEINLLKSTVWTPIS